MGAEAKERGTLFDKRCDDDLALLSVGEHFPCLGIDDLGVEIIVKHMHACLVGAVDADARTVNLGQSVNVIELDAELIGDILPLGIAPPL